MSYTETIIKCTDGMQPYYTSVYKNGDRPTTSSSFEVIGTPAHLGDIIILTNGAYNFGSRTRPPEWWQVGDRAWNKYGEVTLPEASIADGNIITPSASTAFGTGDWIYAVRGAHVGLRSQFAYESRHQSGSSYLGSFNSVNSFATGNPRTTGIANVSFKAQFMGKVSNIWCVAFSGRIGTFSTSNTTTYAYGETVSIRNSSAAEVATAKLLKFSFDDTHATLEILTGSLTSSNALSGSVLGLTSGATFTLPADMSTSANFAGYGANKLLRMNTHNNNQTGAQVEVATALPCVGTVFSSNTFAGATYSEDRNGPDIHWNNMNNTAHAYDFMYDYSDNVSIKYRCRRDTTIADYVPNCVGVNNLANCDKNMTPIMVGMDWAGGMYDRSMLGRLADPMLDYQSATAYMGDSETFASCTKLERCRPNHFSGLRWNSKCAPIKLNYGDIPSGTSCYIFIRNSSGTIVNPSSGFSIGVAP